MFDVTGPYITTGVYGQTSGVITMTLPYELIINNHCHGIMKTVKYRKL